MQTLHGMAEAGKAQNRGRSRTLLSGLLLASGTVLAFLGTNTFLESYFGQNAAERSFRPAASAVAPASLATTVRGPRRGETIAKLIIPRLDAQLYVVEGDNPDELRRGPGHLADTAMPGARGNCVIAGHRDTHFRVLKDIRHGDSIVLETSRGRFSYRVDDISVVSPTDTRALQPTPAPALTLITCYPFYFVGTSPKRFVVQARLAGAK